LLNNYFIECTWALTIEQVRKIIHVLLSLELANSAIIATSIPPYLAGGGFAYKKRKQGGLLPEPIKKKTHELVYSEIFFHEMHCTDTVNFLSFHKKKL
jgi:hypothetical protein